MTDKKSNDSRRKLLKFITAGSGAVATSAVLPDNWVKPAMKSILLPAHALTTDAEGIVPDGIWEGTIEFGEEAAKNSSISVGSLAQQLGDLLISPAHACLLGGYILKIGVKDQKATVSSNGSLVGEENFNGYKLNLSGVHLGGMKLNLQATYLNNENEMQVDIEGLNNAVQCAGVNGSGTLYSDLRLKTDVELIQRSRDGYKLYKFQYIDDKEKNTYVGVMAQDMLNSNPEAVVESESGFYKVRYAQLGLKMVTLDQWEREGSSSVELIH